MNKFKKMMMQGSEQERQEMLNRFNKNRVPTIFDLFNRPLDDFAIANKVDDFVDEFLADVKDAGDHYEFKADLPGVKKEDIKLDFTDGVLTIKANHHKNKEEKKDNFILHERAYGVYERSFSFDDVDSNNIEASFTNGELCINLGKMKKAQKCTIKINQ